MRIEERRVPTYITENVFIAADGKEFYSEQDCKEYELSIMKNQPKVLATAIKNIKSFWDEYPAVIYHIESSDDWELLNNYVWKGEISWGNYEGPGDYIAVEHDGDDYEPSYWVYEFYKYYNDILNDAKDYQKYLFSKFKKE